MAQVRTSQSRLAALLTNVGSRHGNRAGIVLMLASCLFLACGDAAAKWLSATYPVGEIIFVRSMIIIAMLAALSGRHFVREIRPRRWADQVVRALVVAAGTFLMVWSFKLLPLATVTAIAFAVPLIVTALAPWMLGEKVGARRWIATLVGFVGMLFIVDPGSGRWNLIMLVPIAAAVAAAMRDILTRQIAEKETAISVVFITMMVTALAMLPTVPFGWRMPAVGDAPLLVVLGVFHGSAYLLQVAAFRLSEAGLLMPFKYSLLLWTTGLGILVWGDVPAAMTLVGASLVVASGLYGWWQVRPRALAVATPRN